MKKLILSAIASLAIMVSFSSCFDVVQVNDYKNGEYYLSVKASTTKEKFNDAANLFWNEDVFTSSPEDCRTFVKSFFGDDENIFVNDKEFGKEFSMKLLNPEDEKMKEYIPETRMINTIIPLFVQYRYSNEDMDDWKMIAKELDGFSNAGESKIDDKNWDDSKLELNKIYDKYTYTVKVSKDLPSLSGHRVIAAKLTNCGVEVPFKYSKGYFYFEIPASKVRGNESLTIF